MLYQNNKLIEIYIVGLEKEITGYHLLPEAVKRYNYIFRHIDNGEVKFILSVYYCGYYSLKSGGDDDHYIEETGYYNLTDKCVSQFEFSKELIDSLNFQLTYLEFSKAHNRRTIEKQQQLILQTKSTYPETKNFSDQEIMSFIDSITPNI